jgi:hypothetical protein
MRIGQPADDRRQHPRIRVEVPVEYRVRVVQAGVPRYVPDDAWIRGLTGNLSQTGLVVITESPPADEVLLGMLKRTLTCEIEFRLTLPVTNRTISGHGTIQWMQTPEGSGPGWCEVGMLFADLPEDDQIALFNFSMIESGKARRLY